MKKNISILGSTGSIGLTTLSIVEKKKDLRILLLAAKKNYKLIIKQINKYNPKYFIITDKKTFLRVKKNKNIKTKILNTFNFSKIKKKLDTVISAIPGLEGLEPTINVIKNSNRVLIANKESIICGWNLIKKESKKHKTKIIPIDSEHFSIKQLLENHKLNEVEKIFITASGGPFLKIKKSKFKKINVKDAIKHPKWRMGKKISVDSSTLMNKILELIEAHKIFKIPYNRLKVIIHPESLVHAIVRFKNGLVKFIYHETSMIIPIANAIFEKKLVIDNFFRFNLKKNVIDNLSFLDVDKDRFPVINIINKIEKLPSAPIILNASNEILVDEFINEKIPFLAINQIILGILKNRNFKKYAVKGANNINQIKKIDTWARNETHKIIMRKYA